MLTISDLMNRGTLPSEKDISLELLLGFYEQYLCKRIFSFTLEDETKVKIAFKDASEIFHLIGANHIYGKTHMTGSRFAEGVRQSVITLETLKKHSKRRYKDRVERICAFACLDAVLRESEYLWFEAGEIPESRIKVRYLLLRTIDGKNVHLGIDQSGGYTYYPKTLLVTKGSSKDKFINLASTRLKVTKLEIIDKNSDTILEVIERRTPVEEPTNTENTTDTTVTE